jgi:hypothetical protein
VEASRCKIGIWCFWIKKLRILDPETVEIRSWKVNVENLGSKEGEE